MATNPEGLAVWLPRVLGVDEFVFRTVADEFWIRVRPFRSSQTAEQRRLAERVAFAVRVGIEANDPEVVDLARRLEHALFSSHASAFNELDESFAGGPFAEGLATSLSDQLVRGRLLVESRVRQSLTERREEPTDRFQPLPGVKESADTFFEVRFIDEIGQAISGVDVEFAFEGEFRDIGTNAAGVALLENVQAGSASVAIPDPTALERVLEPRWQKPRPGTPKKESNTTELVFVGAPVGPIPVKAAVPNTVVLTPPRGRLFIELFDKTGRVRHAGRDYSIQGPQSFSGTTDENGRLLHDNVFPGDYSLGLTLNFFEGKDQQIDDYESPLVVLPIASSQPQVRLLGAVPFAVLARLHFSFNTNKTFLLPTALPSIHKLRALYEPNNPSELLVVGHADTAGGAAFNDQLSLERAESTIAFLEDDVDAWLGFYDAGIPQKKRWGSPEDRMMLMSMPDFGGKASGEDGVRWFQRTRELQVDGKAGPQTRRQLITEYMALDGASLEEAGITIKATAHGCGEHFPLDDTGERLDPAAEDPKRDPIDRRVELFFFDPEFGITPKPPGENSTAGSTQYPAWRERVIQELDLAPGVLDGPKVTFIELIDVLFRTNSAVVLPEGESPERSAGHQALTSVGIIAAALRFNEEHAGKTLFVAGHTDTTASLDFNQKLSSERARCALSLLVGGSVQREAWKALCDQRHTVSDYKQILSWVSRAFTGLSFDCDPGTIDDNALTGVEPVRRFQKSYNANKAALGATGPDLAIDGDLGPLTWGALFDCYEFALQQELGEDAAGVGALRQKLVFVDDERKALGFSEHFPIEELGVDHFKSQTNRRVEILFFELGEEPDLVHAEADPETTELYLPGVYERVPVAVSKSAKRRRHAVRLLNLKLDPVSGARCRIRTDAGEFDVLSDDAGVVEFKTDEDVSKVDMEWVIEQDAPFEEQFTTRSEIRVLERLERSIDDRLANLGYVQPDSDERVNAFQSEFGRELTGNLADIRDDVVAWHDSGLKPSAGNLLGFPDPALGTKLNGSGATAAPVVVATRFKGSPGTEHITQKGSLFRLDLFPGSHAAITFRNVGSAPILSNNPNVVDSNDTGTFLDPAPSAANRTLFFFAIPDKKTPDTTLFVQSGASGERALFQVRVQPLPTSGPLKLLLKGTTASLNANRSDIVPYAMGVNRQVDDGTPIGPVLDAVLAACGGRMDHLIINAHGFIVDNVTSAATIAIGDVIHRGTLALWDRLKGKVRYIWFQNCVVGADRELMTGIAQRTGAWVSAPIIGLQVVKLPLNTLDFVFGGHVHFNTVVADLPGDKAPLRGRLSFLRSARLTPQGNLDQAMAFVYLSSPKK